MADEPLHVFDLPQLYQKPAFSSLHDALILLTLAPPIFATKSSSTTDSVTSTNSIDDVKVHPEGTTKYLTDIISNPLSWLASDTDREQIWDLASERLAERAGRTAMGDMTRSFTIPISEQNNLLNSPEHQQSTSLTICLHEPALTGDNLGLKTWSSSFILASLLPKLKHHLNLPYLSHISSSSPPRHDTALGSRPAHSRIVLELGAGTGLAGLLFAALYPHTRVILTDLPEIEPNLSRNIALNAELLGISAPPGTAEIRRVSSGILDWEQPEQLILTSPSEHTQEEAVTANKKELYTTPNPKTANIIIAADPLYSPSHPLLLARAIATWIKRPSNSIQSQSQTQPESQTQTQNSKDGGILLLTHPHRAAYTPQVAELRHLLSSADMGLGLVPLEEGVESVREDWKGDVEVKWGVWGFPPP